MKSSTSSGLNDFDEPECSDDWKGNFVATVEDEGITELSFSVEEPREKQKQRPDMAVILSIHSAGRFPP